jgi:hypothetical protein
MKKTRIIKRTYGGLTEYVVQQKHFLMRWMWVDAWVNSFDGASCVDSFRTLEEAEDNIFRFDGTKCKEVTLKTNG